MLTPLQRVRLRTALNNNGYHNEVADFENWISATATLGPGTCWVTIDEDQADRFFVASSLSHVSNGLSGEQFKAVELAAKPPEVSRVFSAAGDRELHALIRRLHQLSIALPSTPFAEFQARTRTLPQSTETERLAVQRIGQDIFRSALLEYWDGRCAVTGLDQPELLRASHIKPWAACELEPSERLDVHNGLLLAADIDAAFDGGLIAFDDAGVIVCSSCLTEMARKKFDGLRVRTAQLLTSKHLQNLRWHRAETFR